MGRAQVVQAQAAGMEPDVRMNPILLKPSSDVGSQVIVNGEVRGQMPAAAYFKLKKSLIPDILAAYDSLAEEVDIIVIEGAGSPAEINLKQDDFVNMGLAKLVDAPVLLIGDIDRGGLYASFLGTWMSFTDAERRLLTGYIVNRFRGTPPCSARPTNTCSTIREFPCSAPFLIYATSNIPEEDMAGFSWGHTDCGGKKRGHWTSPWSCCGTYPITPTLRRSPPNPTSACVRCAVRRNGATPMW